MIHLPEPDSTMPSASVQGDQGLLQWISTTDHKQIGIMYLLLSATFLVVGGCLALLLRTQLAVPDNHFLTPEAYNQIYTMHGITMLFLMMMPAIFGFATYFIPLMIGANDFAFPRLNAFSFWITMMGGFVLYFSFLAGGAPDNGWFNYAPMSENTYSMSAGIDYYVIGLLLVGIGTVSASLNIIVTILKMRIKGMKLNRLPLFVWMVLVNSFLIIAAFPSLNAALCMLLLDRQFDAHFFDVTSGGSALLWEHLFWLFGHPEVYILVLPSFGILSEVFQVFSHKPIFGYTFVAGSTVAIAALALGVWVHHMFAVGLGLPVNAFFAASSMAIGVPTGVKIFNWIGTMHGGRLRFTVSMLFATAFLVEFTLGGLSGISFAIVPIDWLLTRTYYLVAHIHYVFIGGSLFGLFAGLFYWFPKMTGRMLDEKLGKWFFWLFVIGFNLTFMLQHVLGIEGMPRRIFTYSADTGWGTMNFLGTVGAFLMGFAVLLLLINIVKAMHKKEKAPHDPWDAFTLEWVAETPPRVKNFNRVPPVRDRRPLWDLKHPENPDWKKNKKNEK